VATLTEHRELTEGVTSLIPERRHPSGPATRRRKQRTFAIIGAGWVAGALLLLLDASAGWKTFGLGLFWPGGGFLYTSDPILAALSVLAFVLAIGLWWGLGPFLAPPFVWLAAAALASLRTDTGIWDWAEWGVPAILAGFLLLLVAGQQLAFRRARRRGRERNEQLSRISFPISEPGSDRPVSESTPEDLAALRYPLDLGLQPLEQWEGFHTIDQFRESALRYQLQFLQYALAMSQYTRTPAFTGYLAEAQRNAIEKMLEPRVWKYWRYENLWGNLRWDPDPVRRDNVMLSGYWAVMVGLYEAMTGDERYNEPGSLTFRNGEREVYPYDFPRLAEVMRENMDGSIFCMFPCEPNWIYPFCNSYALNTVILDDRLHGDGADGDIVPRFRDAFDQDFLQPDGRVVGIRSGRFGFNIPSTVTVSDAVLTFWLNPGMPDVAQRLWWIMRQTTVKPDGGELFPAQRQWDYIDPGNYRIGKDSFSRGAVYLAASEMGDEDVIDEVRASIDEQEEVEEVGGVRRYPNGSVYANVQHTLARFTRKDAIREMVAFDLPEAWRSGPRLGECAYPDVLVARAVSDGQALELVLRPGAEPGRQRLRIERLRPGARYAADGAVESSVVADTRGEAQVEVDLEDRHELRLAPQP
jgi:hypothetical protein